MEQSESVSDFGPKKLPRQLDFTPLCGASANSVFPEHLRLRPPSQPPPQPLWQTHHAQPPQSHLPLQPPPWKQLESRKQQAMPPQLQPPALERIPHPVHKLPLLPMQFPKQDSPGSRPKGIVEAKDGTPKKPKQCNCKSSQCLKLYCECFAAGSYCNGCNCANCYNNVENEAARQEAVGAILERNPNAFRPKIAGSANGSQDANILCSENCKCMDCKNFEGSEERKSLFHSDCNCMAHIQPAANAAISGTVGFSGYDSPSASKKRKCDELLGVATKDRAIRSAAKPLQENHRRTSIPISCSSPVPVSRTANAAVLGYSKPTYKSPLADILQPQYVKELCSLFVILSGEAAKRGKLNRQPGKQDIETSVPGIQDKEGGEVGQNVQDMVSEDCLDGNQAVDGISDSGSHGSDRENERPQSPGIDLMCHEPEIMFLEAGSPAGYQNRTQKSFSHFECSTVYEGQEKVILTVFRDILNRLIFCASIRETVKSSWAKSMGNQLTPAERGGIETGSHWKHHGNNFVESPVAANPTSTTTADLPTKAASAAENGMIKPESRTVNIRE